MLLNINNYLLCHLLNKQKRKISIGFFILSLFIWQPGFSQTQSKNQQDLEINGADLQPMALSLFDISRMNHFAVNLKDHYDGQLHEYKGVMLSDLLLKAGLKVNKSFSDKRLNESLIAKCADGYEVAFSLGELDTAITNKRIILADSVDGQAISKDRGPLRVIVPGEKKPARSCYKVIALTLVKNEF